MKHLYNISVYDSGTAEVLLPGFDGTELLTGYSNVPEGFFGKASAIHLPYATDWYSIWTGRERVSEDIPKEDVVYYHYGHDREEIIGNVRKAMTCAEVLHPAYGVIHAGCANIRELLKLDYSDSDRDVLSVFAEIINAAVSEFPNGEPPFKLLFENQWWPGLRMLDNSNFQTLSEKIEFSNWGLCLDTGHLLVTTKDSKEDRQAAELLMKIFDRYSDDMLDSIMTVHLHTNNCYDYISRYKEPDHEIKDIHELIDMGYGHVCSMDQHRPFSDPVAVGLVDRLRPEYVTHEMGAAAQEDKIRDCLQQLSLFKKI